MRFLVDWIDRDQFEVRIISIIGTNLVSLAELLNYANIAVLNSWLHEYACMYNGRAEQIKHNIESNELNSENHWES